MLVPLLILWIAIKFYPFYFFVVSLLLGLASYSLIYDSYLQGTNLWHAYQCWTFVIVGIATTVAKITWSFKSGICILIDWQWMSAWSDQELFIWAVKIEKSSRQLWLEICLALCREEWLKSMGKKLLARQLLHFILSRKLKNLEVCAARFVMLSVLLFMKASMHNLNKEIRLFF